MRFPIAGALAAIAIAAPASAHEQPQGLGASLPSQPAPAPDLRAQARAAGAVAPPATPRAVCGPGSRPSPGLQGRVPAGAPDDGYACNAELVSHEGDAGGFKVERFVDKAGHQCAYYDTSLLYPVQALQQLQDGSTGVAVVDMTDPAHPVRTETLVTPAMQTPHESLNLSTKRGLLAAVMGNPLAQVGFVDVYDLNADCRHPALQSSSPVGLLGHESGFAPDGRTFYATSLFTSTVTAVDLSNPRVPSILGVYRYPSHGMSVSDDGTRGYIAGREIGLQIVDLSQVQQRKPSPQVPEITRLRWPIMSVPQNAIPIRVKGKPYLVEIDEFSADENGGYGLPDPGPHVGAGRIIDISNEKAPQVISNLRLEVNQPEHRAEVNGDPGAGSNLQGYAGHYCNVPAEDDPPIVACSFIASGLRVFDIRDLEHPKELAYFVAPPAPSPVQSQRSNYAMSKPAFDVARHTVWYSDGNSGLYAVRLTNGAWPAAATPTPGMRPAGCTSRSSFVIHLRRGLRSARVYVNGRRTRVTRRHSRLHARVNMRRARRGRVVVRIVGRTRHGRLVRQTRRYRACA